jgi:hypothetical protein
VSGVRPLRPEPGADRARALATRAMSLVRSGADADGAVVVLLGLAGSETGDLELARSRCLAALDQDPSDPTAAAAADLLERALRRA